MAITVKSMATSGVDGFMVEIEASTIRGQQQSLSIIGLPNVYRRRSNPVAMISRKISRS